MLEGWGPFCLIVGALRPLCWLCTEVVGQYAVTTDTCASCHVTALHNLAVVWCFYFSQQQRCCRFTKAVCGSHSTASAQGVLQGGVPLSQPKPAAAQQLHASHVAVLAEDRDTCICICVLVFLSFGCVGGGGEFVAGLGAASQCLLVPSVAQQWSSCKACRRCRHITPPRLCMGVSIWVCVGLGVVVSHR